MDLIICSNNESTIQVIINKPWKKYQIILIRYLKLYEDPNAGTKYFRLFYLFDDVHYTSINNIMSR